MKHSRISSIRWLALAAFALSFAAGAGQLSLGDGKPLPLADAPSGKAPIGTVINRMNTCTAVLANSEKRFASIDTAWEYRFTRDSDEDGAADAGPAWAVSNISVYFYNQEEAAACK